MEQPTPLPKKRTKASKFQIKQRIDVAHQLILKGKNTRVICQYMSQNFAVTERHSYRYIMLAYNRFEKETADKNVVQRKHYHIAMRLNLADKCMEEKDYKTANTILDSIAKIEGLFTQKHEITAIEPIKINILLTDAPTPTPTEE